MTSTPAGRDVLDHLAELLGAFRRVVRRPRPMVVGAFVLVACGDVRASGSAVRASNDAPVRAVAGRSAEDADYENIEALAKTDAVHTLRLSAGRDGTAYEGTRDTASLHAGRLSGRVLFGASRTVDSATVPTHDVSACPPFTTQRAPSENGGVGNAVVWLVGVTRGPVLTAPRRAALALEGCRFSTRVQRVAHGATMQLSSRDAMLSRWRFADVGRDSAVRATVDFNDAGQVVPNADVANMPGLIAVRDELHPWARAYLAVTPHPFVAVTPASGQFVFDGVPPGRYTLVMWSEVLGVRSFVVRVDTGVETRVDIR
ncbi:MAG: carboxypeptidase regulatory-like domain-containing protein [Gemmatimonadaceae bacterium]|nr:carboxypeptidase regulatory-like domain-containing protein [Gemmatimonadaceae bacterium]